MSLARYAAKLAALLGSDGKVPGSALASGAAVAHLGYTPANQDAVTFPVRISEGFENPFSTGWSSGYATVTQVQAVGSGTAWASRTTEEKALLTAMGRAGVTYLHNGFYISRVTWPIRDAGGYLLPYIQIPYFENFPVSVCAFVKHESGSVPGSFWCNGLQAGAGWQFCSDTVQSSNVEGYTHCHPYQSSSSNAAGSILVALPAVRLGKIKAARDNWFGPKVLV